MIMGWLLRLNVELYTADNPTLFTGNLASDLTGRIQWGGTASDLSRSLLDMISILRLAF
jgi:hypothetical protein